MTTSQPDIEMSEKKKPGKLRHSRLMQFNISETPPQTIKYESEIYENPMLLVANTEDKLTCVPETLAELRKIEKTLNVVSVVGSLRTGKSFLLNKLANEGEEKGFMTGHTTSVVTKGILVLCRPHPKKEDQVLVLLDTEGVDDPKKVDELDDQWLFILSTLLSSTMVYNAKGLLEKTTVEKFRSLREIKTSVSVTGSKNDDSILEFFFPNFVLALRDVTLTIKEETPDDFMENHLKLEPGQTADILKYNEPRQLIRRYFKKRRCFIFIQPSETSKLKKLMNIPELYLKPEFQKTLNSFRDYIYSCEPKTLKSGRGINGRMLATLLSNYVNSIQDGKPPRLSDAMRAMVDVENKRAVDYATNVYNTEMKRRIAAYTVPTDDSLVSFHTESMKAAIEVLRTELVFDDKQIYEEQALVQFNEYLRKFKSIADKNSRALCEVRLGFLNLNVQRKVRTREYCHPAGYDEYMTDIDRLIKQYNKDAPYLGTQAKAVLQKYIDKKESEEEQVYQMVFEAQEAEAEYKPRPVVQHLSSLTGDNPKQKEAENREKKDTEEEHLYVKESDEKQVNQTVLRVNEETNEKPGPRIQRLSCLIKDDPKQEAENVEKKVAEDETIEDEFKRDITAMQMEGMANIVTKYDEILKLKIKEIERVKCELSADDPIYESLLQETEMWKDLFQTANWNLPQYKSILQEIFQTVLQTEQQNSKAQRDMPSKDDCKQSNERSEQNHDVLTRKKDTLQTCDKLKQIPRVDPLSIDPKFIEELDKKTAPEKKKDKDNDCYIFKRSEEISNYKRSEEISIDKNQIFNKMYKLYDI